MRPEIAAGVGGIHAGSDPVLHGWNYGGSDRARWTSETARRRWGASQLVPVCLLLWFLLVIMRSTLCCRSTRHTLIGVLLLTMFAYFIGIIAIDEQSAWVIGLFSVFNLFLGPVIFVCHTQCHTKASLSAGFNIAPTLLKSYLSDIPRH